MVTFVTKFSVIINKTESQRSVCELSLWRQGLAMSQRL